MSLSGLSCGSQPQSVLSCLTQNDDALSLATTIDTVSHPSQTDGSLATASQLSVVSSASVHAKRVPGVANHERQAANATLGDRVQSHYTPDDIFGSEPNFFTYDVTVRDVSALHYYWQIRSGTSDRSMNCFLQMNAALDGGSANRPSSVKIMKSHCKAIIPEIRQPSVTIRENYTLVRPDIVSQIQIIMSKLRSEMQQYTAAMKMSRNTDILNSDAMQSKPLVFNASRVDLYFLLSCDGASFVKTTDLSIWPCQAIILNAPPMLRQKMVNIVLLGLICSRGKPPLQESTADLIHSLQTSFQSGECTVWLHFAFFVADLPAMASIINIKQFNGRFSCPKCIQPGRRCVDGKTWVFPYTRHLLLRGRSSYLRHARIAERRRQSVFGIKGQSEIAQLVDFPHGHFIDSMHMYFENEVPFIIDSMSNPKLKDLPAYVREPFRDSMDILLGLSKCPVEYSVPRSLWNGSLLKAHDYKLLVFNILIPLLFSSGASEIMRYMVACLVAIYHLMYNEHSDVALMESLIVNFMRFAPSVFSEQVLRLNFHMLRHMPQQYRNSGRIYYSSMFCFERCIHLFKQFICGTRNQAGQIATKFAQFKALDAHLNELARGDARVNAAFARIRIQANSFATSIATSDSATWQGKALHSERYDSALQTRSCCVQLRDGTIGIIESFSAPSSVSIRVSRRLYSTIRCSRAPCPTTTELHVLIQEVSEMCPTFLYVVIDITSSTREVRHIDDIVARCVMVPLSATSNGLFHVNPLLEFDEVS